MRERRARWSGRHFTATEFIATEGSAKVDATARPTCTVRKEVGDVPYYFMPIGVSAAQCPVYARMARVTMFNGLEAKGVEATVIATCEEKK